MVEKSNQKHKPESSAGQAGNNKEIRVFLNDKEEGTFFCPACNNGVIKKLGKFVQSVSAIRIKCKCKCGHVYRVLVERRRYFRKSMNLVGMFFYEGAKGPPKKGLIRILDISQSGIQFSVKTTPEFEVGDRLIVEFKLHDDDGSLIREEGIVRGIRSNKVGLQFDNVEHYGKLGRYLFQ